MEDNYTHKGLRKKLIETLRSKGIDDERVLDAMMKVPRHWFFMDAKIFIAHTYEDKAFPIGSGQTISQPYTVAFQTSLLNVKRREKVLEIGTGSGYQSAILVELGAKLFTIERQQALYEQASGLLSTLGYNARFFYGDGYKGKDAFAPFDKILITCGAPSIPEELKKQLKVGGRMVIPVGGIGQVQQMLTVDKVSESEFIIEEHGDFQFVPMLGNTEPA